MTNKKLSTVLLTLIGTAKAQNTIDVVNDGYRFEETIKETNLRSNSLNLNRRRSLTPCKPQNERDTGIQYLSKAERHPSTRGNGEMISCSNHELVTSGKTYPCRNTHLESFISLSDLGESVEASDIWGTKINGIEYGIIGLYSGTTFVDLQNPSDPIVLGKLPAHGDSSIWRDIKTYEGYAYIVSEAISHGLQVFDMSQFSSRKNSFNNKAGERIQTLSETNHVNTFGNAHNIFINEDSATAYVVGSNRCNGGLYMLDLSDPANPTEIGCHSSRGYTHDVQCVIYDGPDLDHTGKEICFCYNEDKIDIVDATDKTSVSLLSSLSYENSGYVHQGWLTEDSRYILVDDEADEYRGYESNTRTVIVDVQDLDNPLNHGEFYSQIGAIDHNLYVLGNHVYQANYRGGLRILDISNISTNQIEEIGYFDVYPDSNTNSFNGAWSNFPYFDSGLVVVSGIEQGMFVLRPDIDVITDDSPVITDDNNDNDNDNDDNPFIDDYDFCCRDMRDYEKGNRQRKLGESLKNLILKTLHKLEY